MDDVLQESAVVLLQEMERGEARGIPDHRIEINVHRRIKRRIFSKARKARLFPLIVSPTEGTIVPVDFHLDFCSWLAKQEERLKRAVDLVWVRGESPAFAAEEMGISSRTVYRILSKANVDLYQYLYRRT